LASRADKPLRPPQSHQIFPALGLRSERLLKLGLRFRIVFHGPKHYRLGLLESIIYPSQEIGAAGIARIPRAPGISAVL
jgi:hypothetical protein